MQLILLLDNLRFKPFTGEILSSTQSISFNRNFINLEAASQCYKKQANKLCLQPPSLNIAFRKQAWPIQNQISCFEKCFKLSLPSKWKAIHPVFHVSLLEPAKGLYPAKAYPPPETVNFQDHLEWEVSHILDA
ncbi:uncharacterized protein VP01_8178g1, partial [Puccinia sorghi]